MNISGIIVEYNPFHNGHIRHITMTRQITDCDLLIAVTSGNFCQRGDVSVMDKFEKTEAALNYGIDLIVELPFIYTLQNASVFGKRSVDILASLGINNLVFGSETANIDELKKMAEMSINIDHLKEIMNTGLSYPKSYGLLASELYPNDILAVSYLRALQKYPDIKAIPIERNSEYHSIELNEICSASAIRNAIKENRDYSKSTPVQIKEAHFIDELYPYLRNLLLTMDKKELSSMFLVNEGIENLMIKNALKYTDYNDFLNNTVSRRYTRARIQRTIVNILLQNKKETVLKLPEMNYIRVLGFNEKGQNFLRNYHNENIKIVTQFKNIPEQYKDIEWKASIIYSSLLNDSNAYLKKELRGPVIKK